MTHGPRRLTWSDHEAESARFAGFLTAVGVAPGDKIGLFLHNCPDYLCAQFAAFKIRAVPVNVNFRYTADEVVHLLTDAEATVLVYDRALAATAAQAADRVAKLRVLVEADSLGDPMPTAAVTGATPWAVATSGDPAPRTARDADDLYMIYTGGTTGLPKGVVYSMGAFTDWFAGVAAATLGEEPFASATDAAAAAARAVRDGREPRSVPVCPLMHGTGMWLGAILPATCGGSIHLLRGHTFDPAEAWRTVESRAADRLVLVGDPFARPLLRELEAARCAGRPHDTSSLRAVISSGAALSEEVSSAMIDALGGVAVIDVLGASEGGIGTATTRVGQPRRPHRFAPLDGTKVFDADNREVTPGSGAIGWVGRSGPHVPLRYHNDPEKTARTFRVIDGVRYAFAGDMATVDTDGSIVLLGRGSGVINTGGEKVFAEEVEDVLRSHPAVEDALVFGVPDDVYGETVAAVIAPSPETRARGADPLVTEATDHVRERLAGYKVPRRVVVVDEVPRAANGKADYATARRLVDCDTVTPGAGPRTARPRGETP